MYPDQTAPWEQSDQGPYCLQYRPPMYINRRKNRRQLLQKAQKVLKQ